MVFGFQSSIFNATATNPTPPRVEPYQYGSDTYGYYEPAAYLNGAARTDSGYYETSYYNKYNYYVSVDIPNEDSSNYYQSLSITDTLPKEVSFVNGEWTVLGSDGHPISNVTSYFSATTSTNSTTGRETVQITANNAFCSRSDSYGTTLTFVIPVLANPDYAITRTQWDNSATVNVTRGGATTSKNTGTVRVVYKNTPSITRTQNVVNEHVDFDVALRKVDKETGALLADCVFEIRTAEEITLKDSNGTPTVTIPEGYLVTKAKSTNYEQKTVNGVGCNVVFNDLEWSPDGVNYYSNLIYGKQYYIVESEWPAAQSYTQLLSKDGSERIVTFTVEESWTPTSDEADEYGAKITSSNGSVALTYTMKNQKGVPVNIRKVTEQSYIDSGFINSDCYDLTGSTFAFYETYSDAQNDTNRLRLDTLTYPTKNVKAAEQTTFAVADTGVTDWIRLAPGRTYYIREIVAGKGYKLSETITRFTPTQADWQYVTISNVPADDPVRISLSKTSYKGTPPVPLTGAQFTYKYYDGLYTSVNLPSTPTKTWVLQTVTAGSAYVARFDLRGSIVTNLSDKLWVQTGETTIAEKDASLLTAGDLPNIVFPYGTYVITETKAADGYENDPTFTMGGNTRSNADPIIIQIGPTSDTDSTPQWSLVGASGAVTGLPVTATNSATIKDTVMPVVSTKLIGYDRTGAGEETKTPVAKLNGTTKLVDYVYLSNLDDFVGENVTVKGHLYLVDLNNDEVITEIPSGVVATEQNLSVTAKSHTVALEYNFDASALYGRTIVAYVEIWGLDHSGDHGVSFVKVAEHKDVNDSQERITFRETGEYSFYKHGEQFVGVTLNSDGLYDFNYEDLPLQDIHFEVIAAREIRNVHNQVVYTANQVIPAYRDVQPNADGILLLEDLQYGDYILREKTSDGTHAIMNDTPFTVNAETGDTTNAQSVDTDLLNERRKITINVVKTDERNSKPLAGVRFGLYTNEVLNDYRGDHVLDANALVAVGTTDADGKLTFTTDLPVGTSWYLKELSVPVGYELSTAQHVVEFYKTQTYDVMTTVDKAIGNQPRPGELYIHKSNGKGVALQGVTYLLEYSLDNQVTWKPVFYNDSSAGLVAGGCDSAGLTNGMLTTDAAGDTAFSGLLADGVIQYRLTEVKTVDGTTLLQDYVYVGTLPRAEDEGFDMTPYDVNGDGYIDEWDLQYMTFYFLGATTLASGSGDTNGSGDVTNADLVRLKQFEAEWNDATLPVFNNGRVRVGFDITNNVMLQLPSTGSTGFNWLPFAGAVGLLGIAGGIFIILKKRREDEELEAL